MDLSEETLSLFPCLFFRDISGLQPLAACVIGVYKRSSWFRWLSPPSVLLRLPKSGPQTHTYMSSFSRTGTITSSLTVPSHLDVGVWEVVKVHRRVYFITKPLRSSRFDFFDLLLCSEMGAAFL